MHKIINYYEQLPEENTFMVSGGRNQGKNMADPCIRSDLVVGIMIGCSRVEQLVRATT